MLKVSQKELDLGGAFVVLSCENAFTRLESSFIIDQNGIEQILWSITVQMDYVDDPKVLLRAMEMNRIGMKRSLFYQAYALYFEKTKKFEEADRIYHLGVQK